MRYVREIWWWAVRSGAVIESMLLWKDASNGWAPIFIVAPPRSGTTVMAQLMTASMRLAYFSNFTRLFPYSPVAATWVQQRLAGGRLLNTSFSSSYGRAKGSATPNDAVRFWWRWFDSEEPSWYSSGDAIEGVDRLRREVMAMQKLMGGPFLSKDMRHALRIPALAQIFPTSFWIRLVREPMYVAQSLLEARDNVYGDREVWVGAKPRQYESLRSGLPHSQIAGQVHFLNQQIAGDLEAVDSKRKIIVRYEQLCEKPRPTLEELRAAVASCGERPVTWDIKAVPESLSPRNERRISPLDWAQLESAFASVGSWQGKLGQRDGLCPEVQKGRG